MPVTGQCLCGSVQYAINGPLGDVNYCHCHRCRQATGTAFSANAKIAEENFDIIAGEATLKGYEMSPGIVRHFCSICGSPIYVHITSEPEFIRPRIGALTGDVDVNIAGHVWVGSKAPWYAIEDSLLQHVEAAK